MTETQPLFEEPKSINMSDDEILDEDDLGPSAPNCFQKMDTLHTTDWGRRWLPRFAVLFVFLLLVIELCVLWALVLWPLLTQFGCFSFGDVDACLISCWVIVVCVLLPLHILPVMLLISYAVAALSDPGYLPLMRSAEDEEYDEEEGKRFCKPCGQIKPKRVHHCHICDKCVVKMDHHCGFICNCVGHRNLKAFWLVTVYGSLSAAVTLFLYLLEIINLIVNRSDYGIVFFVVSGAAFVVSGWGVFSMGGFALIMSLRHTYFIYGNRAALEVIGRHTYTENYDVGCMGNLKQALGANCCCWFCPTLVPYPLDPSTLLPFYPTSDVPRNPTWIGRHLEAMFR